MDVESNLIDKLQTLLEGHGNPKLNGQTEDTTLDPQNLY